MTRLSVNINKVATIRNARGGIVPNIVQIAVDCQRFGAEGITVHPRPDERHIRYQDVYDLKPVVNTEFNIEGYPSHTFMDLVLKVVPEQVTLVPDAHDVITSNQGWNTAKYYNFLCDIIKDLTAAGIRSSIFIDANIEMIELAAKTGAKRIEFYTEPYATNYPTNRKKAIEQYVKAAKIATELGLELNAGHDLSLENLQYIVKEIPQLKEVSIGHALISDALYYGLEKTIHLYLNAIKN